MCYGSLNKAYVGFSCEEDGSLPPVATGNWGCGAFNGDPHLKGTYTLSLLIASRHGPEPAERDRRLTAGASSSPAESGLDSGYWERLPSRGPRMITT